MVRCRAGTSRAPWVSSRKRSLIWASSASGERIVLRAAASSIASGSPSNFRQSAATVAEELDRLILHHGGVRGAIFWQRQRIDRKVLLGLEMERGATGGQHLE